MFDHFFNCHGELQALFAFIDSWPMIGSWVRSRLYYEEYENIEGKEGSQSDI